MTDARLVPPTGKLVISIWGGMQALHGTSIVRKSDADMMTALGAVLDALGVLDKKAFLEGYTTTIDHSIYIPFELGVGTPEHDLWSQIVLCAHEHQHVVQVEREGWASFSTSYVFNEGARGVWEAEGYRCNMELGFWRTGTIPEDAPEYYAGKLKKAYGCSDATVLVAAAALRSARENILEAGIVNQASQEVIAFFEQLAA